MKTGLFIALGICGALFSVFWAYAIFKPKQPAESGARRLPGLAEVVVGFLANFFDTLGIGSFATTSATFKLRNLIVDEELPGTLNVGHCLPTVVQAFIFIAIVQVDVGTLILMIAASVLGAWLGAGLVSKLPRTTIQLTLGCALLIAATLMFLTHPQIKLVPPGGAEISLHSWRLASGIIGNFFLGALMTLGIGLYAPCMILVSLLGMDPHAAFPIMMGSCAFLMPVGGVRFIKTGRYSLHTALGLTIGGIPGVLIAAYLVKSLPLDAVRWLVIIVVTYTATTMLRSASKKTV